MPANFTVKFIKIWIILKRWIVTFRLNNENNKWNSWVEDANAFSYPNSKYMEEHMLAIPIDQRYFFDDIKEIAERINSISL